MPSVGGERYGPYTHTHPCWTCGQPMGCNGHYSRNHDGWPDAICDVFHEAHHGQMECEACQASRCEECGSLLRTEGHWEHCDTGKALAADPRRI